MSIEERFVPNEPVGEGGSCQVGLGVGGGAEGGMNRNVRRPVFAESDELPKG